MPARESKLILLRYGLAGQPPLTLSLIHISCDLKDPAWFDKIDASGGAVFFAAGVFYYFLTEQVRELVQGMADAFPGGVLVFDAANRTPPGKASAIPCTSSRTCSVRK